MSDDPAAAVKQYLDAFHAGDPEAMAACFVSDGAILDGMAPHYWSGPSAVGDWYGDVMAESAHVGASDYLVTLGEPIHNAISGDSAYFVAPATMAFVLNGQKLTQSGSTFTVALRREAGAWRIAVWAWSKGKAA